ncbi:MAG TPA: transcription antitermination factor NusB, partial [Candidatus Kapabacteria bacterium]|nr:transcription antitermination factor NusB [Candidatus Kapabacteria bacterium]
NFPEIPEKVTINEIIEISKNYSTDKSNIFINGLLDNFRKKLKEQGKIKKSGKGLLEK